MQAIPRLLRDDSIRDFKECSNPSCHNLFTSSSTEPEKCSSCHEFELRSMLGLLPKSTEVRTTELDDKAKKHLELISQDAQVARVSELEKKRAAQREWYHRNKAVKPIKAPKPKKEPKPKREKKVSNLPPKLKRGADKLAVGTIINGCTLLEYLPKRPKDTNVYIKLRCHCGTEWSSRYALYHRAITKSCGCLKGAPGKKRT